MTGKLAAFCLLFVSSKKQKLLYVSGLSDTWFFRPQGILKSEGSEPIRTRVDITDLHWKVLGIGHTTHSQSKVSQVKMHIVCRLRPVFEEKHSVVILAGVSVPGAEKIQEAACLAAKLLWYE
jgi:hypothetical protein